MFFIFILICCSLLFFFAEMSSPKYSQAQHSEQTSVSAVSASQSQSAEESTTATTETSDVPHWNEPTGGSYPAVAEEDKSKLSVEVSLAKQEVYVKKDNDVIYTMICSTGDEGMETPAGEFEIEAERGESFIEEGTGTCYNWVSFSGHGIYLFHSIPMETPSKVNQAEAEKFGKPASHGCIRLSMPDSEWFYNTLITGNKVTIK